ncbi:twin-arginine translocation signal domain-containing protein [Lujinxingia vulgaris]|uniref:Twin-arginine translocation signal domain-containing protein n=1 Tax=Lujinxingia vulgaris TaxID=2600176 RepID=A0A5C6X7S0_9DELT|nr:metallophosphoesterase [Lujinxingia vulgaris]TXD37893.1 twin-arginine translocation signal domain-containing protein [Lujinxingia vulgaris]
MPLTRRTFLKQLGTLALAAGTVGAADLLLVEPGWLEVTGHRVRVPNLARHLRGYRVVQVTDVHMARFGELHEAMLQAIDRFDPNLIALTGDIIERDSDLEDFDTLCDHLMRTGRRVVATLGNWEHRARFGVEAIATMYRRHRIELYVNEHLTLPGGVVLACTDDSSFGQGDILKTCRNLPEGDLRLLLTHAPGILEPYPVGAPRFDLTLAGHTHGGQVRVFGFAPVRPPGSGRFVSGSYQTQAGLTYVSRGIGTSTLPIRLGCRPELACFEFVEA